MALPMASARWAHPRMSAIDEDHTEEAGAAMFGEFPGAHVVNLLAQVFGLIRDAFQAPGDGEKGVDDNTRERAAGSLHFGVGNNLRAQMIGAFLEHQRARGQIRIGLQECLSRIVKHVNGKVSQLEDLGWDFHPVALRQHQGLTRDTLGIIPDAFQILRGPNDGEDEPEVTGRGLVPGEELQALPVQLGFRLVDVFVPQHYAVSKLAITFRKGLEGVAHCLLAQPGHFSRVLAERGDVPLQVFLKMWMRLQRANC